ncbi:MAG: InlB B-repeat-containing protein [Synergistaceae bacterium]|nr:InlB B-repeat-containing protein [Synergistaceae bacterium]
MTFNSQGGSGVPMITDLANGSKITKPADPTRSRYTFGGWYKEASCQTPWNFTIDTVTKNVTLYAKWTPLASTTPTTPISPDLPGNPATPIDPTTPATPGSPTTPTTPTTPGGSEPSYTPPSVETGTGGGGGGCDSGTLSLLALVFCVISKAAVSRKR